MQEKEIKIKGSEYSVKDSKGNKIEFGSFIPLSQFGKPDKKGD